MKVDDWNDKCIIYDISTFPVFYLCHQNPVCVCSPPSCSCVTVQDTVPCLFYDVVYMWLVSVLCVLTDPYHCVTCCASCQWMCKEIPITDIFILCICLRKSPLTSTDGWWVVSFDRTTMLCLRSQWLWNDSKNSHSLHRTSSTSKLSWGLKWNQVCLLERKFVIDCSCSGFQNWLAVCNIVSARHPWKWICRLKLDRTAVTDTNIDLSKYSHSLLYTYSTLYLQNGEVCQHLQKPWRIPGAVPAEQPLDYRQRYLLDTQYKKVTLLIRAQLGPLILQTYNLGVKGMVR